MEQVYNVTGEKGSSESDKFYGFKFLCRSEQVLMFNYHSKETFNIFHTLPLSVSCKPNS